MDSRNRTYQFTLKIISFVDRLPKDNSTQIIAKQLLRAAASIGANVAEAQASTSRRDFANFFSYSLKSAHETKYWLELLKDSKRVDSESVISLIQEADVISKILGSSLLTLKKSFKLLT